MKFTLLSPSHFIESLWSGGSTKQLYIFPEDASYAERNFQFRISTAKVVVSESTFTSLSGFSRKLMILEGEISVTHENQYSKELGAFEVDAFSGDWNTTAIGTCVDFNVMTNEGIESDLESVQLSENVTTFIALDQKWKRLFLYVVDGNVEVSTRGKQKELPKESVLMLTEMDEEKLGLQTLEPARVVIVRLSV